MSIKKISHLNYPPPIFVAFTVVLYLNFRLMRLLDVSAFVLLQVVL